jgi:phage gp29-like protein
MKTVKRAANGRSVKVRKNGHKEIDAKSTMNVPVGVSRIVRNAAAFRWIPPAIAAITPRRLEAILRSALSGDHWAQWQLFDLMLDTWPVLSACQQELQYGVTRRDVVFDPYAEEDEKATSTAIEKEKLVTAALKAMNPDAARDENAQVGTIKDIMSGWFCGISVLEVIWQLSDLKKQGQTWIPKSTYWVDPSQYAFSEDGELGLVENSYPTGYGSTSTARPTTAIRRFPPNKFLICFHKSRSGSPLAGPMLRCLAWWWCASNFASDWLLNLAQVFGLPFRWANYAASTPDDTVAAICDALQNMGSAGWAAFPEGTTLELKETSHTGSLSPQGDLLERADNYARIMILGQTMTGQTIASGRGGQSFGTVEAQLKQDRLDAACGFVAEIFNRQLIPYILQLNYGETSEPPSCRFLQETEGTYQDAQRDQILASTLGVPIPFSHLQQKYNIPEPTGKEEVTEKMIPPAPGGIGGPPKPAGPKGTSPVGQTKAIPKPGSDNKKKVAAAARFEELSQIEDPEIWARELRQFAAELVTPEEENP